VVDADFDDLVFFRSFLEGAPVTAKESAVWEISPRALFPI
jgi:hypothetical protein